jgi:hypothetical protein
MDFQTVEQGSGLDLLKNRFRGATVDPARADAPARSVALDVYLHAFRS